MPKVVEVARYPGTVCWLPKPGRESKYEVNRHGYVITRCLNLVPDLSRMVLEDDLLRVVWVEAGGHIKGFHPATPLARIIATAHALAYQGVFEL